VTVEDNSKRSLTGEDGNSAIVRLVLIREGSGYACRVEREGGAVKRITILSWPITGRCGMTSERSTGNYACRMPVLLLCVKYCRYSTLRYSTTMTRLVA